MHTEYGLFRRLQFSCFFGCRTEDLEFDGFWVGIEGASRKDAASGKGDFD